MPHDGDQSDGGSATGGSVDWVDEIGDSRKASGDEYSLQMTVVEYTDRPDRCTIYPPGLSSIARMSTWLSADRSTFESLSERR